MNRGPVSIFATCLVDSLFPDIGIGLVRVLDRLGIEHRFPEQQTCCGQPAFNAGFIEDAAVVGQCFVRAFADAGDVVTPSGSCAAYVRRYLPQVLEGTELEEAARGLASRTWEFSEYLVDVLGVTDLDLAVEKPTRAALHNGCHGSRFLGIGPQPRALLQSVNGLTLVDHEDADECCGFGGLFAVKMPHLSAAMMETKLDALRRARVDLVLTGDAGCMMHLNGGAARSAGSPLLVHYAEFLGGLA
jgi:L-lactate dehydrogenase complex protein LldE